MHLGSDMYVLPFSQAKSLVCRPGFAVLLEAACVVTVCLSSRNAQINRQAGGIALEEHQWAHSLGTKRISSRAFRASATRWRKPRLGL
jgi:hypothetical protein